MKTASLSIPFAKPGKTTGAKGKSKKYSYISLLQIVFGINRLYLFEYNRAIIYLSYLYTVILFVVTSYCLMNDKLVYISMTYTVYSVSTVVEYACTISNALLQRKSLFTLLEIVTRKNTLFYNEATVYRWSYYVAAIMCVLNLCDVVISLYIEVPRLTYLGYFPLFAQDTEILLYCFLLNQLYMRVVLVKAHVERVICGAGQQKLHRKSVSIGSLHEAYDLLRTCSRSINTAFNFTLSSIFFVCGTTTIVGAQSVFLLINKQLKGGKEPYFYSIVFIICRCIKCAFLVTCPCYSITLVKNQVRSIRSLLHSGLNSKKHKYQRDELKAFFQLTKDNDFSHQLFSVLNLGMDFPLKYLHTCLTYIIILIQFSKFLY